MKSTMQKAQQGFTLIELMIVVAIIGILASVALPSYQNYTAKAKFAGAISSAEAFKVAVGLCMQTEAIADCDAGSKGIPVAIAATDAVKDVTTIGVLDGVITVTSSISNPGNSVTAATYIATPTIVSGVLKWAVTGTCTTAPAMC
ncbi:MAG: prepilin-type N-terminal cleavage/methylation domain-containing protein [Methylococcales bacterium]